MFRAIFNFLDRNIGRCPACMRQAFLAAFAASLLAITVVLLDLNSWVKTSALLAAGGLTILWVCHVVAYAFRTTLHAKSADGEVTNADETLSRRYFTANFLKTAAFAVVAIALSTASSAAQGRCDCSRCSSSQVCCRTANGYCGCFPSGIRC